MRRFLMFCFSAVCFFICVASKEIEKIQKRATKLVTKLKNKSYIDRLIYLNLPTLKYRRLRGDMIKFLKLLITYTTEQYHLIFLSTKELTPEATTRPISCKIIPFIMTYESIFSARIVNIWNSLPNSVVDACTVNAFKARLDKFFGSTNQLSLISQPT